MNWKLLAPAAGLACVGAAVAAAIGAGESFILVAGLSLYALVFGAVPCAVGLLVLVILGRRASRRREGLAKAAALTGALFLFLVLLVPANAVSYVAANWRFERAKSTAERTAAALDAYRAGYGRYPESLEDARAAGFDVPVPEFAQSYFYEVDREGGWFSLRLESPTDFFTVQAYDSENREWRVED